MAVAKPAAVPPINSQADDVRRVYFSRVHVFHLAARRITMALFDTPKALAFDFNAVPLGADAAYYYFRVTMIGSDFIWAFSVEPNAKFSDHAIWSRRDGDADWTQHPETVVMAQLK